jgi:hypothetical protein
MSFVNLGFLETLQKILGEIFNTIFAPIITTLLQTLFKLAGTLLNAVLNKLLYQLLVILLKVLDFLSSVFDIFSGARYVHYYDNQMHVLEVAERKILDAAGHYTVLQAGTTVRYQQTYLLDLFLNYNPVTRVFLMVSLFAAGLAFLFTIYAVTKSISDMTLDGKNPVGKILGRAMKAALTFLTIPLTVFLLLQLSTTVVVEVNDIITRGGYAGGGEPPTMGTIIFLTGSLEAHKGDISGEPNFTDSVRIGYYNGTKHYYDMETVERDFDIAKFDTLTCIVCACLMIIIMITSVFLFVRRIFEVLVLYLASPFFVSTMPLDDGKMFSQWMEAFIAKLFSGFGVVFTMKVFLMLVPLISGPYISLHSDATINSILKLFIIIGGAWATYKSQHLFLQILNPEAAMAAQGSVAALAGMAIGAATGGAALLGSAFGRGAPGVGKSKSVTGGKSGVEGSSLMPASQMFSGERSAPPQSQAFTGK